MTEETKKDENRTKEEIQDHVCVTHHTICIGKKEYKYTATTGTMVLKEETEGGGEAKNENEGDKPKAGNDVYQQLWAMGALSGLQSYGDSHLCHGGGDDRHRCRRPRAAKTLWFGICFSGGN